MRQRRQINNDPLICKASSEAYFTANALSKRGKGVILICQLA